MTTVPDPTPGHQTADVISRADYWLAHYKPRVYGDDIDADLIGDLRAALTAANQRAEQAEAVIHQILGIHGDDWHIEEWQDEFEGWVASLVVTCVCDHPSCVCCDPLNLSAGHLAVLRALVADQPATDQEPGT